MNVTGANDVGTFHSLAIFNSLLPCQSTIELAIASMLFGFAFLKTATSHTNLTYS